LKIIKGNPGRRPLPENEPVPPEGAIDCPEWVTERARVFWERHEPVMTAMGVLTTADVDALAVLCETEAEFWDAREDVKTGGARLEVFTESGSKWVANPSVAIASDAFKRAKSMMVEFGLTPSSRTRVKAQPKPEKKSALQELRDRKKA